MIERDWEFLTYRRQPGKPWTLVSRVESYPMTDHEVDKSLAAFRADISKTLSGPGHATEDVLCILRPAGLFQSSNAQ